MMPPPHRFSPLSSPLRNPLARRLGGPAGESPSPEMLPAERQGLRQALPHLPIVPGAARVRLQLDRDHPRESPPPEGFEEGAQGQGPIVGEAVLAAVVIRQV